MARLDLRFLTLLFACSSLRCAGPGATGAGPVRSQLDATPAVELLQASRFDEAEQSARAVLAAESHNPVASAVAALTLYKRTMHDFVRDLMALGMAASQGALNHRYARWTLEQTDLALGRVDEALAVAAADPAFALRQCLACWQADWNHDGNLNWRDETLFQIELDAQGNELPEEDPRRKPTFRFDVGDLAWARAMVAFQRAVMNLVLAYSWTELDQLVRGMNRRPEELVITLRMQDQARVLAARELILHGLAQADVARKCYLAETDDEGEWVPNPRQHNHPLPLPVDEQLYDTWAGVLHDLTALLGSQQGLSIAELAQLGDHQWADPPTGFLDLGRLLTAPGDIVLNGAHLDQLEGNRSRQEVETVLRDLFGDKYVARMEPTPLIQRLRRMKQEVERGEESFERKLRYLFWLN